MPPSVQFNYFKLLSSEMIADDFVDFSKYSIEYDSVDGQREPILRKNISDDESFYDIPGTGCDWDPRVNNIIITRKCTFRNTSMLFGEKGLVPKDAVIGMAAVVLSSDSNQRFVSIYSGEIIADEPSYLDLYLSLPAHQFRGEITIKTALYLKNPSSHHVSGCAIESGTIFGFIEDCLNKSPLIISMDGEEYDFPTHSSRFGYSKPLWKLRTTWTDPRKERFCKNSVCIIFNQDHKDYKKLGLEDEKKDYVALNEIFSAAIFELIMKIKNESAIPDYWTDTVNADKEKIDPGSVSDMVAYILKEKIGVDNIGNIDEMYSKIRSIMREAFDD